MMHPANAEMDVMLSVHIPSQTGSRQTRLAPDGARQRWTASALPQTSHRGHSYYPVAPGRDK